VKSPPLPESARRMAELAEQLGASDLAIHGWSLLAIMARMSGELDKAAKCTKALERVTRGMRPNDRWLAWAATFSVTVARGERGLTPPFPPDTSSDPCDGDGGAHGRGRVDPRGSRPAKQSARFENSRHPDLGPIGDLGGVFYAIGLVLAGRGSEALPWVERSGRAARALDAAPASTVAIALRAEITGDIADLPEPPAEPASVSDVLVLRAHAVRGDPSASAALHRAVTRLAMPGLAAGI
jgi:hypothetical protein